MSLIRILPIQKTNILKHLLIILWIFTSLTCLAQDQTEVKKTVLLENMPITIIQDSNSELIAIQISGILKRKLIVSILDNNGKLIENKIFRKGSTICHIETQTLYNGTYTIKISNGKQSVSEKVTIEKEF